MSAAGQEDANQPRLFKADITTNESIVPFKGDNYIIRSHITAYGGVTADMNSFIPLLTGHKDTKAAGDHFRKIVSRFPQLKHNDEELKNHIKV